MNHLTTYRPPASRTLCLLPPIFYFCRKSSTNPPTFAQNKPNFQNAEIATTLAPSKTYENNGRFTPLKAKPNKPNQTQSKPNFSPVRASRSQSKPKQTQFIAATPACRGEVIYEAGPPRSRTKRKSLTTKGSWLYWGFLKPQNVNFEKTRRSALWPNRRSITAW